MGLFNKQEKFYTIENDLNKFKELVTKKNNDHAF